MFLHSCRPVYLKFSHKLAEACLGQDHKSLLKCSLWRNSWSLNQPSYKFKPDSAVFFLNIKYFSFFLKLSPSSCAPTNARRLNNLHFFFPHRNHHQLLFVECSDRSARGRKGGGGGRKREGGFQSGWTCRVMLGELAARCQLSLVLMSAPLLRDKSSLASILDRAPGIIPFQIRLVDCSRRLSPLLLPLFFSSPAPFSPLPHSPDI